MHFSELDNLVCLIQISLIVLKIIEIHSVSSKVFDDIIAY